MAHHAIPESGVQATPGWQAQMQIDAPHLDTGLKPVGNKRALVEQALSTGGGQNSGSLGDAGQCSDGPRGRVIQDRFWPPSHTASALLLPQQIV